MLRLKSENDQFLTPRVCRASNGRLFRMRWSLRWIRKINIKRKLIQENVRDGSARGTERMFYEVDPNGDTLLHYRPTRTGFASFFFLSLFFSLFLFSLTSFIYLLLFPWDANEPICIKSDSAEAALLN